MRLKPIPILTALVVGGAICWLVVLEYARRSSLTTLCANSATCQQWRGPFASRMEGNQLENAIDAWFTYPDLISTEPSHLVSDLALGRAIRALAPRILVMTGTRRPPDADMQAQLARTSSIVTLDMESAALDDSSIAFVAEMRGLQWLSANHTGVTDRSLETFAKCRALEALQVWDTAVTPPALEKFANAHPHIRLN